MGRDSIWIDCRDTGAGCGCAVSIAASCSAARFHVCDAGLYPFVSNCGKNAWADFGGVGADRGGALSTSSNSSCAAVIGQYDDGWYSIVPNCEDKLSTDCRGVSAACGR